MKLMKPFRFLVSFQTCALFFLLTQTLPANAATFSWTNSTGGNWNVSANWSPNGVPGGSDTAIITTAGTYTVTVSDNESVNTMTLGAASGQVTFAITGGTFTLNGSATDSAQSVLTMTGGTLAGAGTFAVGGPFNWSGGTMDGIVQSDGGNVTVSSVNMFGGQIINEGVMGWSANPVFQYDGALISNTVTGTLNVTNAVCNNESGGVMANAGQMNIWSSSTINVPLTNFGTININSGTLAVGGGGANIGTITVASGAAFNPSGGTFTCLDGSIIAGAGDLNVSGGTVNLDAALDLTGTWGFSGGTATYTGTTTASGFSINISGGGTILFNAADTLTPALVAFTGGTLGGSQVIVDSGPFNWSGGTMDGIVQCNGGTVTASGVNMFSGQIINAGAMDWSGNPIFMYNGSLLSNAVTGTINVTNAAWFNEGSASAIVNAGQMSFWSSSTMNVSLTNFDAIDINSGVLGTGNGGTDIGTITVASGATFNPNGGTFTCLDGSTIAGAGDLNASGSTVNLGGALNLTGTWGFSGATATYTGTTTVSGFTINVSGGTINFYGAGTLAPSLVTLSGGTLGGSQVIMDNGAFNWSGGTMNGIVQCTGGSVTASSVNMYSGQIINAGVMGWNGNPVFMYNGALVSNTVTGTLNFTNTVCYNEGSPSAIANAGQMDIWSSSTFSVALTNLGTINVNTNVLTLNGGASLINDTLDFTIISTTNFGTLAISGPCSFSSTTLAATADGYTPKTGDTFPLITYGSETGLFGAFILPQKANWEFDYGPTVFSLIVSNLNAPYLTFVPLTPSGIDPDVTFLLLGPIGSNYTIQASTNLAEKDWTTVTNFVSTVSSFYLTDTNAANYEARFFRAIMH
jgi:hypothetical protein